MTNSLPPLNPLQNVPSQWEQPLNAPQNSAAEASHFQNLLIESISHVNQLDQASQAAIQESLAGGDITQVEVFSSVKKADLALRMMLQVRNKLMQSYNEIKQMQM